MTASVAPFQADEAFRELKRRVIARTGHAYYEDKDDLLWERVRRRLAALRLTGVAPYLARLEDVGRGEAEWTALEAEITIGETFFFRYAEQFAALRATILPDLLARNAGSRRLRIWSAGCATGAEPYSIAILLTQLLGEALADWRITILGTDINENFLAAARSRRFSRWALRALDTSQKAEWFDEEDGGQGFCLKRRFAGLVTFRKANLLELLGPAPPLELTEFDLVLCRNVLIYFAPATVEALVGAFVQRLRPDGWLLLGHAEPNPSFARLAEVVSLPGSVAYRPRGSGPAPVEAPAYAAEAPAPFTAPLPAAPPTPAQVLDLLPQAPAPPSPPPPTAAPTAPPTPIDTFVERARACADVGDFAGVDRACAEGLELAPTEAALHYYAGLAAQARGLLPAAEDALRRASYLDPGLVVALYALGLVRLERGRIGAGRQAVAAAGKIAGTLPVNERLREGGGLSAADLRAMARAQLDAAPGAKFGGVHQ